MSAHNGNGNGNGHGSDHPHRHPSYHDDEGLQGEAAVTTSMVEEVPSSSISPQPWLAVAPSLEVQEDQIATLVAKMETTARHVHQVDESVVEIAKTLQAVRRDVQFVKDTVREMQEPIQKIPAIMDLLKEILGKL